MTRKPVRRNSKTSKSTPFYWSKPFIVIVIVFILSVFLYTKRDALAYYLSFKTDRVPLETRQASLSEVIKVHNEKAFGLDVSEYQERINWDLLSDLETGNPIEFIFIRATAGSNKTDSKFHKYWGKARETNMYQGAYHYYRPNENSIDQANNYIKTVKLKKGDFPPVLDIEKLPRHQSIDSLKVGLQRWLDKVEKHYGVKPIIYSSESYYNDFLKNDFEDYPFWIANYTAFYHDIDSDWSLWQITENGKIEGIRGCVDVNVYNGTTKDLKELLMK
ncbi:glycoside hydrolase family 25 protein [Flavobacterium sp.]|uniref:glycoside hydrolase family 25 protein n=1 Tax=Flavobacterium sp. TaxID=239 RepID=UPI00286D8EE9|nr:glycoside hydrolase family 25 protein [Flavobacterium sp.]